MKITDPNYTAIGQIGDKMPVIDGIEFENTELHSWHFSNVILRNCLFNDTLSNNRSPSFFWGCVFDNCIFKGRIGKLKFNTLRNINDNLNLAKKNLFESYQNIQIAIDIRDAQFTTSIDLNAVPGNKILINNIDQIIVDKEKLNKVFNDIDWHDSAWKIGCRWAIEESPFSHMAIFPCGTKKSRVNDMALIHDFIRLGLTSRCTRAHNI